MKTLVLFTVVTCLWNATGFAQINEATPPVPTREAVPGGQVYRDVCYLPDVVVPHTLDLYVPDKVAGPLPVVVWIHGGGWYSGDKSQAGFPQLLVQHGYAYASINYRLSYDSRFAVYPFPVQLHDCKAAIRWLRDSAGLYGLDANHIGCWGESAGGHLAALLGVTGDSKTLEGDNVDRKISSRVQAVCDWYGPADLTAPLKNYPELSRLIHHLLYGTLPGEKQRAVDASPVTYASQSAAPFLIMHGDKDDMVPLSQSEALAAALRIAHVDTTFVIVHGAAHGLTEKEAANNVIPFFDKYLKPAAKAGAGK